MVDDMWDEIACQVLRRPGGVSTRLRFVVDHAQGFADVPEDRAIRSGGSNATSEQIHLREYRRGIWQAAFFEHGIQAISDDGDRILRRNADVGPIL